LLGQLAEHGFRMQPIAAYFEGDSTRHDAFLRHDVDRLPTRALVMAQAESALGIASTYYFRCDRRGRFPARVIERIGALGHEVGFHYECLSRAGGDPELALERFGSELAVLRGMAQVRTVSPHGAPSSAHSNMDFARAIGLAGLDLIGDASLIDFTAILYITDTGGTFGSPHNRRDRPAPGGRILGGPTPPRRLADRLRYHGESRIVLSCHPERWPKGLAGLIQARLLDALINLAKAATGPAPKPDLR
jgi:hypothetical protein